MKNTTIITMAALLLGSSGLMAETTAYTKPSGFVTHTLKAGQFNLIGLTLHEAVTVTGSFTEVSGTALTDDKVDFSTTLTAGKTYILEVTSGALVGSIQEVAAWSGDTITTPADLAADGLAPDDTYQMRATKTLQDIFGLNNEAGLLEGASGTADLVWVPDGVGGFNKYYYSPAASFPVVVAAGWKTLAGADAPAVPICYTDAFFVQRRGNSDLDLVITGSVITNSVVVAMPNDYTFISGLYPVGATLDSSSLKDSMLHGASGTADLIWIPKDDATGYDTYYYHPGSSFPTTVTAGWKLLTGDDSVDQKDTLLKSGMIIQRRAASPYNALVKPPASYSNL